MTTEAKLDITKLSVEERLKLIELLWDSLEPEDVPVTPAQRAELNRRAREMDNDPELGIPWRESIQRARERLK